MEKLRADGKKARGRESFRRLVIQDNGITIINRLYYNEIITTG